MTVNQVTPLSNPDVVTVTADCCGLNEGVNLIQFQYLWDIKSVESIIHTTATAATSTKTDAPLVDSHHHITPSPVPAPVIIVSFLNKIQQNPHLSKKPSLSQCCSTTSTWWYRPMPKYSNWASAGWGENGRGRGDGSVTSWTLKRRQQEERRRREERGQGVPRVLSSSAAGKCAPT